MMRRRMAPLAIVGLVAVAIASAVSASSAASAATTTTGEPCPATVMQTPEGTEASFVQAADPTGRFQAGAARGSDHSVWYVVLWQDGTPRIVANDDQTLDVVGVNKYGHIVGNHGRDGRRAWRYRNGSLVDLPAPTPGWETQAAAINGAGTVVGTTTDPETRAELPVVWLAYNVVGRLPMPPGYDHANIAGIDANGTVAGNVYTGDMPDAPQPIVWFTDGTYRLLPGTDGTAWVTAISAGKVVAANNLSGGSQLVSWNARRGGLTVLSIEYFQAVALNSYGELVVVLPTGGNGFVGNGVVRPLSDATQVVGLTNTHVAYGWKTDLPSRWDCAT